MNEIQLQPDWSDKIILIAEDLDDNFAVLAALLKKTHASLLRANNGQEAIDMISANPDINIILMDISMPDMDGVEATRTIKEKFPQTVIIAQTAHGMSSQMEKIMEEGFDDILLKPIRRNLLIEKLSKYLS